MTWSFFFSLPVVGKENNTSGLSGQIGFNSTLFLIQMLQKPFSSIWFWYKLYWYQQLSLQNFGQREKWPICICERAVHPEKSVNLIFLFCLIIFHFLPSQFKFFLVLVSVQIKSNRINNKKKKNNNKKQSFDSICTRFGMLWAKTFDLIWQPQISLVEFRIDSQWLCYAWRRDWSKDTVKCC
jgi:hypothetical protein